MITFTPHSVGLLWTSAQPRRRDLYLTSTNKRQTSMPPGGILTHNFSKRAAADRRLWPHDHWDRHSLVLHTQN